MEDQIPSAQEAEAAFEERVAGIVAKLIERNSLSSKEARTVRTEADKLLDAVQAVIDGRVQQQSDQARAAVDAQVKHYMGQAKLVAAVVALCMGLFTALLIPAETRKAIGRLLVPDERLHQEAAETLSKIDTDELRALRTYIDRSSVNAMPAAFKAVADSEGASMVAESIADQIIGRKLVSYFSQVESSRLASAGPQTVVEYGSEPRLFDAVEIGEQFYDSPTGCGEKVPANEPVAIVATPIAVEAGRPKQNYFWFGCPGAYPTTWIRLENHLGRSGLIRVISVERGMASSEKNRPEVRLNYAAVQAARVLGLAGRGRSDVMVRVVKACLAISKVDELEHCKFSGGNRG